MEEKIKEFLKMDCGSGYGSGSGDGDGYGSGSGSGDGYGYGSGSGDGDGYGSGSGSGDGYGYGYGSGSGYGDGYGSGSGYGYGYGSGSGYGSGYGDGYGDGSSSGDGSKLFSTYNGEKVYEIDGIPTIIKSVQKNVALAFAIEDSLQLTKCYIARVGNSFAHGDTLKEAFRDAQNKHLSTLSDEAKVAMFIDKFSDLTIKYEAHVFYAFHTILTGSCEFGRKSFMSNKGILMTDLFTALEFLELTKNEYNNEIINSILNHIKTTNHA